MKKFVNILLVLVMLFSIAVPAAAVTDDFVPSYMSKENYDACASRKALVFIPDAGHGLSYPVNKQVYLQTLYDFFGPDLSAKK